MLYETSQRFEKNLDQSSTQSKILSIEDNSIIGGLEGELLKIRPKVFLSPWLSNSIASKLNSFKLLPKEQQMESVNVLQLEILLMTNDQVIYGDTNEWPSVANIAAGVNILSSFGNSFWLFRRPEELEFVDEAAFCLPTLTIYELRKEDGLVVAPVHISWRFGGVNLPNSPAVVNLRFLPISRDGRTAWRLLPDVWWPIDSAEVLALTLREAASLQNYRQDAINAFPQEAALLKDDFFYYSYFYGLNLKELPSPEYLLKKYKKYVTRQLVQEFLTKVAADRYHQLSRNVNDQSRSEQTKVRLEEVSLLAPLAFETAEALGDPVLIARANYELLCSQVELWGDNSVAQRQNLAFQQSFGQNRSNHALAYVFMANARLLSSQNRYAEAINFARISDRLLTKSGDKDAYLKTEIYLAIASNSYLTNDFNGSEKYYQLSEKGATATPGFNYMFSLLNGYGAQPVYFSNDKVFFFTGYDFSNHPVIPGEGAQFADYELAAYQKIVSLHGQATVNFQSNPEESLKICQKGLLQCHQLGCLPLEEDFLQMIGQHWQEKDELGKAAFYLRQALEVVEDKGGSIFSPSEQLTKNENVSSAKNLSWHWRATDLSEKVAAAYFNMGYYNRSITYYRNSLTHVRESSNKTELDRQWRLERTATTHAMIAGAYIGMGAYEEANSEVQLARKEYTLIKDKSVQAMLLTKIVGTIATIAFHTEDANSRAYIWKNAEYSLLEANETSLSTNNVSLQMEVANRLGNLYSYKGKNSLALAWHKKALLLASNSGSKYIPFKVECLNEIASDLIKLNRLQEAEVYLSESISTCRHYNIKDALYWALCGQGQILLSRNQPKQAAALFKEAVNTIDQIRGQTVDSSLQMSFSADTRWANDGYIRSLLNQNHALAAWKAAEDNASRKLREIVASDTDLLEDETDVRERVILEDRIARLRKRVIGQSSASSSKAQQMSEEKTAQEYNISLRRLAELEQKIYLNSYSKPIPRINAAPATLSQTAAALPNHETALVQYIVLDQQTVVVFVIKKTQSGQPLLFTRTLSISSIKLNKEIKRYMDDPVNGLRIFGNNAALSQTLYSELIGPIAEQLNGIKQLIVVPDKFLWALPFQTLQINQKQEPLITRYAVSYAPSATVFIATQRVAKENDRSRLQDSKHSGILIMSAPGDLTGKSLQMRGKSNLGANPYLTHATDEVNAVAQEFPNRHTVEPKSEDGNASELEWKKLAAQYRYLHIISHGEFNNSDPLSSHLILAPSANKGGNDGFLTAREIATQRPRLKANLTVLSACETARGSGDGAEGILGMTWALLAAGSPSIVAGQWEINDQTAPEIMRSFYANLNSGKSKSESLRLAQLKAWKTGRKEPGYWAPYILVGAP